MPGIGIGTSAPFLEHLGAGDIIIVIPPEPPVIEPNTLSITLPVPDPTFSGDMLLAMISTDGNPTITHPAGWDLEDEIGGTAKSFIYRRLSPGGEPASYTWDLDGAEDAVGAIVRFLNVDPDDPINAKEKASGTGSTIPIPSITTTVDSAMLLTLISLNDGVLIDPSSLKDQKKISLWLVNSSGETIGSVGSSLSYKTVKRAGVQDGYNLTTAGLTSTDYYIIELALSPDTEILFSLMDSSNNRLLDSDGNRLLAE
jgi:hypothetical protein